MTINECLESIQKLTRDNLRILETINKAFSTKREHLVVNVNDTQYVIPSFISLENKINTLQQNLENIVNAPATGEAFTYFDGTTQRIELGGYSNSPAAARPTTDKYFGVYSNDIFKDFIEPMPYTRLQLTAMPNSIKNVCVKKVALKNADLIDRLKEVTGLGSDPDNPVADIDYPDLAKVLYNYTEDTDYVDYDTIKRIPLRGQNATGSYTVASVNRNWHDENFSEYYEISLNEPLTYFINDGTIERNMQVGDQLVTSNDKVIMEIISIAPTNNTLTVRIMYGGYVDLLSYEASAQYGSLKFYASVDFDSTKYIDVPLEEDEYICVFVATINDTTNVRSNWGRGLFYDTYKLTNPSSPDDGTFEEYYANVNNIGDTLFDITHLLNSAMYNITVEQMGRIRGYKPAIDSTDLTVTQINKHLNDSETVKTIRDLYAQKNKYKTELESTQVSIDNINKILTELNFNTTDNNRAVYESQLSELNTKKTELTASVLSITNEISANVNAADTPIENAKYHIRGFLGWDIPEEVKVGLADEGVTLEVVRIDVEYRYRNRNKVTGNAEVIGNDSIYTDWNKMQSEYRNRTFATVENSDTPVYPYKFVYEDDRDAENVISFNQVDIPITQGEVVDVRYRYEYSIGFPFVRIYSDWSEVYTQTFPDEYLKDVPLLTIVEENNNDIEKNAFNSMLVQKGLIAHEEDKLIDQNITYFHKPEHIASGFYTDERRVIPLADMLQSFYDDMQNIKADVYGSLSDSLVVTLYDDTTNMVLVPYKNNEFTTKSYNSNTNKRTFYDITNNGDVEDSAMIAYSQIMINLYNSGEYNMKFHTMFPGPNDTALTSTTASKFNVNDYAGNYTDDATLTPNEIENKYRDYGVWMQTDDSPTHPSSGITLQRYNQILYFRTRKIYSSPVEETEYIGAYYNPDRGYNDKTSLTDSAVIVNANQETMPENSSISTLYPYIGDTNTLSIPSDASFVILKPGESIDIPLCFYYYITDSNKTVSQTMAFDIRTSLFSDPNTYEFTVKANLNDSFALQGIKKIEPLSDPRSVAGAVRGNKVRPVVQTSGRKPGKVRR